MANNDLYWLLLPAILVILITILVLVSKFRARQRKARLRNLWDSREKDVVTLHMFDRALNCPNTSPFPIKLELYLRMTGIKYIPDFEEPMGSKNKCPWITINGKDIPDSQMAINYLSEKLGKDIEEGFTEEEKAVSKAFRILIEDHFYWCGMLDNMVFNEGSDNLHFWAPGASGMPENMPDWLRAFMFKMFGKKVLLPQAKAQGMGRHGQEEVEQLGRDALSSYSAYLGDKPFLLGDRPCLADLSMFGFVCLSVCLPRDTKSAYRPHISENCENLLKMRQRLIKEYWPDFDQCVFGCEKDKKKM